MHLASLIVAGDLGPGLDLPNAVQWFATPVTMFAAFMVLIIRRVFVTGAELREAQEQIRNRDATIAAKDALIAKKDEQIAATTKAIIDETVPAVVRATMVMDTQQAELRARH